MGARGTPARLATGTDHGGLAAAMENQPGPADRGGEGNGDLRGTQGPATTEGWHQMQVNWLKAWPLFVLAFIIGAGLGW